MDNLYVGIWVISGIITGLILLYLFGGQDVREVFENFFSFLKSDKSDDNREDKEGGSL